MRIPSRDRLSFYSQTIADSARSISIAIAESNAACFAARRKKALILFGVVAG
jgi:hypothetical protein